MERDEMRHRLPLMVIAAVGLSLTACAGEVTGANQPPPGAGQTPAVSIAPPAASMAVSTVQAFSATVTGVASPNVVWTVREGPTGGSITSGGLYSAPSTAGTFHVVATIPSSGVASEATVVVAPVGAVGTVTKVYVNDATVEANGAVQLTAVVTTSGAPDTSLTWSLDAGSIGAIDPVTGVYVAPNVAGVERVWATSKADPSKKDYGLVTVTGGSVPPVTPPATGGAAVAFPGAQGGGAVSVGGRGGAVHEVTNLNDSGAGSLRACVAATGPRTCVFKVAGTIYLASALEVVNPYLTIAGQTAPGGGIQLTGTSTRPANMPLMRVRANDVVVRYLRLRQNSVPGDLESGGNGSYGIGDNDQHSYNTIFDHISATYACGKQFSIWSSANGPHNVTIQWSILGYPVSCAQGDGGANTGLTGADSTLYTEYQTDIDWHHNLITSSTKRMPLFKSKSGRIVNNIIYNWDINSVQVGGGAYLDVVGNYWKPGPMGPGSQRELGIYEGNGTTSGCGGSTPCHPWVYVSGNKSDWHRLSGTAIDAANWNTLVCLQSAEGDSPCISTPPDSSYLRTSPLAESTTWNGSSLTQSANQSLAISVTPAEGLLGLLVPNSGSSAIEGDSVGASRRLDCAGNWVAAGVRDSADTRELNDVVRGTGLSSRPATPPPPSAIATVGATCAAGAIDTAACACLDTDHDGMPDAWELANGLDPTNASDGRLVRASGYTNLEYYLAGR